MLKLSITSSALPHSAAVRLAFWNSDHVVLKLSIRSLATPRSAAVLLGFWNYDHLVLKSSIRSSATPFSAAVCLSFWNSEHDKNWKWDVMPMPPTPLEGQTDVNVEIVI